MKKQKSLTGLLHQLDKAPKEMKDKEALEEAAEKLQLNMLRIQQGIFHKKERVVIMLEGFDAAGKGGAIRALTEKLDPRSVKVIPIGVPTEEERGKHWLYRFWTNLPAPGNIVVFDRSWYGRVLIEKVDKLTEKERLKKAYAEINEFEAQLQNDGIIVIKFFLAITKDEQLSRFMDRLDDPYKQWKISMADIDARKKWNSYVEAVDEIFKKTNPKSSPWHVIPANSKKFTRLEVLKTVTKEMHFCEKWLEEKSLKREKDKLVKLLQKT
jgi:polyphosphate kinase 2 (PPK2 family)